MRNMILFFMFILRLNSVFGMDNYSDDPDSITEKEVNLKRYAKEKQNLNDFNCDDEMNVYDQKLLSNDYVVENYEIKEKLDSDNSLKRKHKSNKILQCESCEKESTACKKSKIYDTYLCEPCYRYKHRHNPLDERNFHKKHKDTILVCESCQNESTQYIKGKVSGKSLCDTCYRYEYREYHCLSLDERKYGKHKDHILVCEVCHKESTRYKTGKFSGKSLCDACYGYEYRHDRFVPLDERRGYTKHKDYILACEFCQKDDKQYMKSLFSSKSLCKACYEYERKYGHLVERKKYDNHKAIFACEFCQKESTRYIKSKSSGISLCKICYNYEYKYGHLVSLNERKSRKKYTDTKVTCDFCQRESTRCIKGKISAMSLCMSCYIYEYRYGNLVPLNERKNYKDKDHRNDQTSSLNDDKNQRSEKMK